MKTTINKHKFKIVYLLLLFTSITLWSNNLTISNISIVSTNNTAQTSLIQFDVTWENSFRDATNWDAAWIVIKFREAGNIGAWSHATLRTSGHTAPSGSTIDTPSDGKGVFIYRDANGSGTFSATGVQLIWEYGTDSVANGTSIDVTALGLEMVYVPQGAFYVGDGNTASPVGNFEAGGTGAPFQITSEAAITLGGAAAANLNNNNGVNMLTADDFNDSSTQTLPAAFPKGFDGFYHLKHEFTQQAFVSCLNLMSSTQAATLMSVAGYTGSNYAINRYGVTGSHPNLTTTQPYAPLNYVIGHRSLALADFLALRPMTELEYEKACRGTTFPVTGEYAWGTNGLDQLEDLPLVNIGAANEGIGSGYTVNATNGNCWVQGGGQNMTTICRVGIFAGDPNNTGRITSGATAYGAFEMSGNVWERVVTVGAPAGRQFTGLHGDGTLSVNGYANVVNWPGGDGVGSPISTTAGIVYRGGSFEITFPDIEVSNRFLGNFNNYQEAIYRDGSSRFTRTAP